MTKTRKTIGNILIIISAAFIVYLSAVMLHRINTVVLKEVYIRQLQYELIGLAVFLLLSLDIRFGFLTKLKPIVLKAGGWILRITLVLLTAVQLFYFGKVTVGGLIRSEGTADHAIVLGMALENGKPTDELLCRIAEAERFLQKNPDGRLILTGGNADASGKSEADVMHDILAERGVAEDRMILEDRAKNTAGNFRNSAKLINPGDPVVLISSDYHMDRAVRTAQKAGFTNVLREPAPSPLLYYATDVMGEVMTQITELTRKI